MMKNKHVITKFLYAALLMTVSCMNAGKVSVYTRKGEVVQKNNPGDDDIKVINISGNVALVALVYTKNGKVVQDGKQKKYVKLLTYDTLYLERLLFNPLYDRDVIISLGENRAFY